MDRSLEWMSDLSRDEIDMIEDSLERLDMFLRSQGGPVTYFEVIAKLAIKLNGYENQILERRIMDGEFDEDPQA